jgi:hypothetical protein
MRRSSVVQLTLLPILATAAVAVAQPSITDNPPPMQETEVILSPPGMTPTIQQLPCDRDPNWELRPDCNDGGGVVRGGFGSYFWSGGG